MSKSLGNSPDPLDLIEKYGADGVRVGMLFSSPAGNDLMFDESHCEQGRNFANKIWNAFRLVKGWEVDDEIPFENELSTTWFDSTLAGSFFEIEKDFASYRLSEVLITIYKLVWDDFCGKYLELIKPIYGKPIDRRTYNYVIDFFERILILLHPFMPFLTEEIWNQLRERSELDKCIIANWPVLNGDSYIYLKTEALFLNGVVNNPAINKFVFPLITNINKVRNEKQISPKKKLSLLIRNAVEGFNLSEFKLFFQKLANVEDIKVVEQKPVNSVSYIISNIEFYIPIEEVIDVEAERERIQKELDYLQGFLKSVTSKLSNERFVQNAKAEIVANEQQKKADAEAKIVMLEEGLAALI